MIRVITASNTNNHSDFGGTPYRLIEEIKKFGRLASGVNLRRPPVYHIVKFLWVICRIMLCRKPRGFQFSSTAIRMRRHFLNSQIKDNDSIISFFQICTHRRAKVIFLIDCTLKYLFESYPELSQVPNSDREAAIEREKESYKKANHIFCKSTKCVDQVINDYGIPQTKVSLIPWVANFEMELKPEILERRVDSSKAALNLLFVGKDSYRKGLDKVLRFQSSMDLLGIPTTLHVIGLEGSGNYNPNVIYHGYLPKDSIEFSEIFEQSHLGFLVSRSEALGIAALEYQAAGIPTVLSGVDGMLSTVRTSTCLLDSSDDLESTVKLVYNLIVTGAYQQFLAQAFEEAVKARNWSSISEKVVNEIES